MIGYIATQLAFAALGFAALFAVAAVVVWRDQRRRRAHYRYWNGRT